MGAVSRNETLKEEGNGHLIRLWCCRQVRHICSAAQVGQCLVSNRTDFSSPIVVQLDDACTP